MCVCAAALLRKLHEHVPACLHALVGIRVYDTIIVSTPCLWLQLYVNNVPYIRREVEMPAAALHHAGVAAGQLQELEQLMKEDVMVSMLHACMPHRLRLGLLVLHLGSSCCAANIH